MGASVYKNPTPCSMSMFSCFFLADVALASGGSYGSAAVWILFVSAIGAATLGVVLWHLGVGVVTSVLVSLISMAIVASFGINAMLTSEVHTPDRESSPQMEPKLLS